jgi:hypothetical protein
MVLQVCEYNDHFRMCTNLSKHEVSFPTQSYILLLQETARNCSQWCIATSHKAQFSALFYDAFNMGVYKASAGRADELEQIWKEAVVA